METKVKGTITEQHADEVRQCFGDKVAKQLEQAEPGGTFLDLLFAGYADEMKQK